MRRKNITTLFLISALIGVSNLVRAQHVEEKFRVVNRTKSMDKKSGVLHLDEVDSAGMAWIIGKEFTNGTIEFEIKGKDTLQSSFLGIAFHGLNDKSYEVIYFRPFNFRATDPIKKSHSVQYIALPSYDWPILRDNFPNKYEQAIPSDIDPNEWFHVKIQLSGNRICVYVNGSDQPVLEVQSLAEKKGKMIGYWVGYGSGGDWKNLKIIPDTSTIKQK